MKYAVLGTGMVGVALATKLIELGHDVRMGAREAGNEKAAAWATKNGPRASSGAMRDAAAWADRVILAVAGGMVVEAAKAIGNAAVAGKLVIDVTNPLDFSRGMPPILIPELSNTTSAGEAVQAALPSARVVKTLNTMRADLMVNPSLIAGDHDVFLSGDDAAAKAEAAEMLAEFGWTSPLDLGPISASRGTEGLMPFWLRMWGALGHPNFNYRIAGARTE